MCGARQSWSCCVLLTSTITHSFAFWIFSLIVECQSPLDCCMIVATSLWLIVESSRNVYFDATAKQSPLLCGWLLSQAVTSIVYFDATARQSPLFCGWLMSQAVTSIVYFDATASRQSPCLWLIVESSRNVYFDATASRQSPCLCLIVELSRHVYFDATARQSPCLFDSAWDSSSDTLALNVFRSFIEL